MTGIRGSYSVYSKMKQLTKRVNDPTEFYPMYLTIMNGVLGLTSLEIKVLAEFMYLKNWYSKTKSFLDTKEKNSFLFCAESRKVVQKRLGISQHNLNNYIKSLKSKRMLVETEDNSLDINASVYINIPEKVQSVKFDLVLSNESIVSP